ncbi:MAG: hypothetical protein R2873_33860 [Caldilineaceae bacterium]|nr:hypothetical protein [Caldilineaceae bacterium]
MIEILLMFLAFIAAAICIGLYWQVQKSEARVAKQAAEVREQALVVGELADEITQASTYLYEAMDRFLVEVETQVKSVDALVASSALVATAKSEDKTAEAAPQAASPVNDVEEDDPAWWEMIELEETSDTASAPESHESEPVSEPEPESESGAEVEATPYHPHFQALALAAEGKDLVEIARQTGLGVEELRLLLQFQNALSMS